MTDAEVIAAIRRNHLQANISETYPRQRRWDLATVDPGGTIFGPGPYVKLPIERWDNTAPIRVYAPERLRRQLAKQWRRS